MRRLAALLLVAPLLSLPVAAQDPGSLTIWAHGQVRDGEEVIWINGDVDDPRATDTANGPGYCPPPLVATICSNAGNTGFEGDFEHTFTLPADPTVSAALALGATMKFVVGLGANSGECSGDYDTTLRAGSVVVAEAKDVALDYANGYQEFSAEAEVLADIGDGAALEWVIEVTCTGTGLFLGVHKDTVKSRIILPLAGSPAARDFQYFDLSAPANLQLLFHNATDATYTYNWTQSFENTTVAYNVEVEEGSVEIWLVDGADGNAFKQIFTATTEGEEQGQWTAGPWQLRINATAFRGSVTVQVYDSGDDPPPSPSPTGTGTSTMTSTSPGNQTTTSSGTTTGNGTSGPGGNDTPGPALGLLITGFAAAAFAARRRT